MNEMKMIRKEELREARREEKKELKKMRYEEREEEEALDVIVRKIRLEIKYLLSLQESKIKKIESQMRIYPAGNEALHELKAHREILAEEMNHLAHLFHISEKLEGELRSSHLLPVEVSDYFRRELNQARILLRQCRTDFSHFGGASGRIVYVYNTIPGAMRVERRMEKTKMHEIEHQARM
jgi:hypothetical protein